MKEVITWLWNFAIFFIVMIIGYSLPLEWWQSLSLWFIDVIGEHLYYEYRSLFGILLGVIITSVPIYLVSLMKK